MSADLNIPIVSKNVYGTVVVPKANLIRRICQQIKSKMQNIWHSFAKEFQGIQNPFRSSGLAQKKFVPVKLTDPHITYLQGNSTTWIKVMQALRCLPRPIDVATEIQVSILAIDQAEAAFKEQNSPATRAAVLKAYENAFNTAVTEIASSKIDPTRLPTTIALQMCELLTRYGICRYADKAAPHPFQTSLDVFRVALTMQEYALRCTATCPDLTKAITLDVLHKKGEEFREEGNTVIDSIDKTFWATRSVLMLTPHNHGIFINLLRYTNGAMNYLDQLELGKTDLLLGTAELSLLQAQKNAKFTLVEVNDQLAELKYNEISGFLADQAVALEKQGASEEASKKWSELETLWKDAIALSKNPEKMRARICNKRIFTEGDKMTTEQKIELVTEALEGLKKLPAALQDMVLIANYNHNLSHLYQKLPGNDEKAYLYARDAFAIQSELVAKGIQNAQFTNIVKNFNNLLTKRAAEAIEKAKQVTKKLEQTLAAVR